MCYRYYATFISMCHQAAACRHLRSSTTVADEFSVLYWRKTLASPKNVARGASKLTSLLKFPSSQQGVIESACSIDFEVGGISGYVLLTSSRAVVELKFINETVFCRFKIFQFFRTKEQVA
ncbi:Hypothetical_protein [Hexamita inflata]|uniref:Hypothetical_protein n=1 Tax=Hexamita inflata TaxID=28002 RepID=A0AA86R1X1_9EUKA|nr:Hypothetical protein HINF_LOCUS56434 [Hexamita inflata]CAI9968790.1 Hypothetical protein HINF_LOCUS56435 [Hexamita inflata]